MFKFITHRSFLVNLLVVVIISLLVALLFLFGLDLITRHGKNKPVPLVKGKNFKEVKKILDAEGFEYEVQDSVYYDSIPGLTVVRQLPDAGEIVKANRTIYLTVNRAVAPLIDMPNLVGQSYRNAEMLLQALGLKLGEVSYKADEWRNIVLEQKFNGKNIIEGEKVPLGSKIKLVVSSGFSEENQIEVPDLIGFTYAQAKAMLDVQGLRVQPILDKNVKDSLSAYIYKQEPVRMISDTIVNKIAPGNVIYIFLSLNAPDKKENIENK